MERKSSYRETFQPIVVQFSSLYQIVSLDSFQKKTTKKLKGILGKEFSTLGESEKALDVDDNIQQQLLKFFSITKPRF